MTLVLACHGELEDFCSVNDQLFWLIAFGSTATWFQRQPVLEHFETSQLLDFFCHMGPVTYSLVKPCVICVKIKNLLWYVNAVLDSLPKLRSVSLHCLGICWTWVSSAVDVVEMITLLEMEFTRTVVILFLRPSPWWWCRRCSSYIHPLVPLSTS